MLFIVFLERCVWLLEALFAVYLLKLHSWWGLGLNSKDMSHSLLCNKGRGSHKSGFTHLSLSQLSTGIFFNSLNEHLYPLLLHTYLGEWYLFEWSGKGNIKRSHRFSSVATQAALLGHASCSEYQQLFQGPGIHLTFIRNCHLWIVLSVAYPNLFASWLSIMPAADHIETIYV